MTTTTDDEAAIRELLARGAVAETAGDVEGFIDLLTDDAMMLPHQQPAAIGIDAIRDWWQATLAQGSMENTAAVAEEVQVLGDWAYLRVSYSHIVTSKADGGSYTETGKSLWLVKRQQDGSWKFSHVIWNPDE